MLSGTKTYVKQCFLPLMPLLMISDVLWSPVLPARAAGLQHRSELFITAEFIFDRLDG